MRPALVRGAPVAIETPMRRASSASGDWAAVMLAAANRADPCGRLGSPQEIAETVAFLMPAEPRHAPPAPAGVPPLNQ